MGWLFSIESLWKKNGEKTAPRWRKTVVFLDWTAARDPFRRHEAGCHVLAEIFGQQIQEGVGSHASGVGYVTIGSPNHDNASWNLSLLTQYAYAQKPLSIVSEYDSCKYKTHITYILFFQICGNYEVQDDHTWGVWDVYIDSFPAKKWLSCWESHQPTRKHWEVAPVGVKLWDLVNQESNWLGRCSNVIIADNWCWY